MIHIFNLLYGGLCGWGAGGVHGGGVAPRCSLGSNEHTMTIKPNCPDNGAEPGPHPPEHRTPLARL